MRLYQDRAPVANNRNCQSESLRVYKELTIDPDIPWGVQTVETREKAEHALKQAIINSPVIDASVGERLQELSDWRFYLIGQQEKKKKRKKQAQDTAVVGFDNITGMSIMQIMFGGPVLTRYRSEKGRRRQ